MTDDLDLRALHRRHDPDPGFVAALEDRLQAIVAPGRAGDSSGGSGLDAIDLEPTTPPPAPGQRRGRRLRRVAVAVAAVAASITAVVVLTGRDEDGAATDPVSPSLTLPLSNGWAAFGQTVDGDVDIYLVRPGGSPVRAVGSDREEGDQVCPAFSPDGARLAYGQAAPEVERGQFDASLLVAEVRPDGSTAVKSTFLLEGATTTPCPIWSPSGRWLAFGAADTEVWLVDTETRDVRRLPGYAVSDLEWRPGTDELAIAHHGIDLYSVTTDDTRSLDVEGAVDITWSPDGTTIAFTRLDDDDRRAASGAYDVATLWLVDADGTDQRQLTADSYLRNHGVGPAWSPAGDRIAYQRVCKRPGEWLYDQAHPGVLPEEVGTRPFCLEENEVVLITPDGARSGTPAGTETVIPPPMTLRGDEPVWWYPFAVTWSPDASMLLYQAWTTNGEALSDGVLALPVHDVDAPIVLVEGLQYISAYEGAPSLHSQRWGVEAIESR